MSDIVESKQNYDKTAASLQNLIQKILEAGEITQDDDNELVDLLTEYDKLYNTITSSIQEQKNKTIRQEIDELKNNKIGATVDDLLNILTENGRKTFIYKDDDNNILIDMKAIPSLVMLVNKFKMIASDGEDESSIVLTPNFIELLSNSDILLKAKNINLEGLVTANGYFKILEDGSIEAVNGKFTDLEVDGLNVSRNLTADSITVRQLNCANLPGSIASDMNVTVDPSATDATNIFANNAKFTSLQNCINNIPKNLNGYTVNITVNSITYENITIKGFNGGTLYILFKANNFGYVFGHNCSSEILLQGTGTTSQTLVSNYETSGNSTAIQPSELLTQDGKNYAAVFCNCPYVALFDLEVYGKTGNTANYAVGGIRGSYVDLEGIKICGSENGVAAERGGRVFESNTTGKVNGIAQNANCSGTIYIQDGTTINGTISKDNSSQIIYSSSGAVQDTTSDVGTNNNTTTATSTITITSTGADTYRSTTYYNYKQDNTSRQGNYGWGNCNGLWVFGNKFTQLKGKTITKLSVTVNRIQGGIYGNVTATLKMHNYEAIPSGMPSYIDGWNTSITTPINTTKTIEITDAAVLNAISAGTCKGFGVQGPYDSSHYAVFDGNCTITATIQG